MNDRCEWNKPKKLEVPPGRDLEIEQCLLDMVLSGEASAIYSPVWRDMILVLPGQMCILEPNEQN